MINKMTFLAGAAAGYVLGTKAGRGQGRRGLRLPDQRLTPLGPEAA